MTYNKWYNLFVYGSLKDPDLFFDITDEVCQEKDHAVLIDFGYTDPVFGYPAIESRKGSRIEGEIIYNVSERALAELDRYEDEGGLYQRITTRVIVEKHEIEAEVYIKQTGEK